MGHGTNAYEFAPRRIEALANEKVAAVAAGTRHSFAVTADGCLFGWGRGKDQRTDEPDPVLGLGLSEHCRVPLQYQNLRVRIP